ncbi:uncharacterized protein B0P05DRAFT_632310 [Gilbertella persicaria]|uniref:uncharacterized protein n=1 Tax=Gilbertella persicaria TaxID=101096 RepID=UPI00221EC773|nr:uncharacterized protein B0P05DRAFT_632310 [Gilbertella persicaria]KAI8087703.1 hypothetical protein B0P05DRAFT_632310 [Gilbertella persicaria]
MDVSQLCSDTLNPASSHIPANHHVDNNDIPLKHPSAKVRKIDFLLSDDQEPTAATTATKTIEHPESITDVLVQCAKLCKDICQLKLGNKSMTENERDRVIDNLSESAKIVYKSIQSVDHSTTNNKKRHLCSTVHQEDEEDEDDLEDEDLDEESQHHTVVNDHAEYELIRQARNIQNNNSHLRPKYRRRNKRSMIGQKCHSCSTTETPEWRRGPDGARTLCNACGLHYSKLLKKGSIGVQTQNYLITGGSPRVSSSANGITANVLRQSSGIEHAINYPFVLMDPKQTSSANNPTKIVFEEKPYTNNRLYYTQPSLQRLPSLSSIANNIVNNNEPKKPLTMATPLRIHQWKHQE